MTSKCKLLLLALTFFAQANARDCRHLLEEIESASDFTSIHTALNAYGRRFSVETIDPNDFFPLLRAISRRLGPKSRAAEILMEIHRTAYTGTPAFGSGVQAAHSNPIDTLDLLSASFAHEENLGMAYKLFETQSAIAGLEVEPTDDLETVQEKLEELRTARSAFEDWMERTPESILFHAKHGVHSELHLLETSLLGLTFSMVQEPKELAYWENHYEERALSQRKFFLSRFKKAGEGELIESLKRYVALVGLRSAFAVENGKNPIAVYERHFQDIHYIQAHLRVAYDNEWFEFTPLHLAKAARHSGLLVALRWKSPRWNKDRRELFNTIGSFSNAPRYRPLSSPIPDPLILEASLLSLPTRVKEFAQERLANLSDRFELNALWGYQTALLDLYRLKAGSN